MSAMTADLDLEAGADDRVARPRRRFRRPSGWHLALIPAALIMAAPLIWMVITSLSSDAETRRFPPGLPATLRFGNYADAWAQSQFGQWLINSSIVSLTCVLSNLMFCSLAGYAFARLRFPGSRIAFIAILATLMVPFQVVMIPTLLIVKSLHLVDSLPALVAPNLVTPFGIYLLRQFFVSLPIELEEAALIDGAGRLRILRSILLPLMGPPLSTVAVLTFLSVWNDFLWPLAASRHVVAGRDDGAARPRDLPKRARYEMADSHGRDGDESAAHPHPVRRRAALLRQLHREHGDQMMKRLVAGALAVTAVLGGTAAAAAAATAAAATTPETIVVAPSGDDRAAGTTTHPVRSIQTAVDRVTHGGTVELRGGIYHERGLLTGVQHLMIRPYRHEHPVLSGRGLTPPPGLTAMVEIASVTDVTVTGLEITGYRTTRLGVVPAGIYVHGYDRGVRLTNNHVHHLGNDNPTLGSFDINAHGIAVYGDDPHAPITGVAVDGNELDHLKLGASETLVLNGNVTNWSVVGNHIHDDNNIGIDAIGFEGTLPGRYRYTQRNRARHGLIANNTVSDIRSRGNPAYWEGDGWCNCADGIYVDGGTQLTIRGNHVTGSDIGVEVAAENARGSADHVAVIRNRIEGSLFTGITTGGYCDGKRDCGQVRTGTSHDNVFAYNVLRHNNQLDDGSPELLVQYHAYRNTFVHNTIDPARGQLVIYGTVDRSDSTGNHSDHNQFVGPANGLIFGWQRHTYIGFAAYRAGSGQDARSRVRMLPRRPASGGSRHGSDASRGDDGGYSARSFACVLPCRRLR